MPIDASIAATVGLREFRARLSDYIAATVNGQTVTLTEHHRPVARLVPVAGQSAYERLLAAGAIQPGSDRQGALDPPVTVSGLVSDLIADQRA